MVKSSLWHHKCQLGLGSRTSTHRSSVGGVPARYHRPVPEIISSVFSFAPYQCDGVTFVQHSSAAFRWLSSLGSGAPFIRGRPLLFVSGGSSKRLAPSLNRLIRVPCLLMLLARSWVPKLLSPTKMTLRSGSHRMVWSIPCLAQSVSFLCLNPCLRGIAFRRDEKRLKWQGLDACLPWQWNEKRETEPPQATGFDKMTATGAHRVTIDPASVNH